MTGPKIAVPPGMQAPSDQKEQLKSIRNAIALEIYSRILPGALADRDLFSPQEKNKKRLQDSLGYYADMSLSAAEVFLFHSQNR